MSVYSSYTDHELLHLISQDDINAFELIYERYWAALYAGAYKQLQDREQSKDIVQDIFTDLWIRRGKVSIENLKSYLLSAIRFQVYNLVDRQKVAQSFYEPFRLLFANGFSADSTLADKELSMLFQEWLATLPEKRKQIFILHYSDRLSTSEIASRLNISQKTVQNQLGTAVADLRKRIIFLFSITA